VQKQISSAVLFFWRFVTASRTPLFSSHLQKITAGEPSKSCYGQARLVPVGAGFGG
jgi:hypothetical protein